MLTNKKSFHRNQLTMPSSWHNLEIEETDEQRLVQRQKQIYFGMVTRGYYNLQVLLALKIDLGEKINLPTPDKFQLFSKKQWDNKISEWRRYLHTFDDVILPPDYEKNSLWQSYYLPQIVAAKTFVKNMEISGKRSGFFATTETDIFSRLSSDAEETATLGEGEELEFNVDKTHLISPVQLDSCKIDLANFY